MLKKELDDLLIFLIIGDENSNLDGTIKKCYIKDNFVLHSDACIYLYKYFKNEYNYLISNNEIKSNGRDHVLKFSYDVAKCNNILFYNASFDLDNKYGFLTLPSKLTLKQYNTLKQYEDELKDYYLNIKVFDNNKQIYYNALYKDNKLVGYENPFVIDNYYDLKNKVLKKGV